MTAYSGDYCARYRDLLPLYALGNASGEEAAGLREHLESCAVCRREVHELEAALNLLPLALPQAAVPAAVKARLLEQIDVTGVEPGAPLLPLGRAQSGAARAAPARPDRHDRPPAHERADRHDRAPRRWWRAVEVAIAVAAGVAIYLSWQGGQGDRGWRGLRAFLQQRGDDQGRQALQRQLAEERAALTQRERELAEARAELALLRQPDLQVLRLAAADAAAEARDGGGAPSGSVLLARSKGVGLVIAHGLPRPPGDRDYQVWLLVKDPAGDGTLPIPAGILQPREGGALVAQVTVPSSTDLGALAAAAVTLEQKGGAQRPTTAPLLTGTI